MLDLSSGGERFYPVHPAYIPWIRRDDTGKRVTGLRSLVSMVVSISNELTTDDFVKMKFLLEDHPPRWEMGRPDLLPVVTPLVMKGKLKGTVSRYCACTKL